MLKRISPTLLTRRTPLENLLGFDIHDWNLFGSHSFNGLDFAEGDDGTASLSIEVPGMKAEHLDISSDKQVISVKGDRKDTSRIRSINTSFTLPPKFDPNSVQASLEDGILTLSFTQKPTDTNEVKKIAVQSKSTQTTSS